MASLDSFQLTAGVEHDLGELSDDGLVSIALRLPPLLASEAAEGKLCGQIRAKNSGENRCDRRSYQVLKPMHSADELTLMRRSIPARSAVGVQALDCTKPMDN